MSKKTRPAPAGNTPPAPSAAAPARKLSIWQHLAISSFWFAVNLHWGALLILIIPSQATRLAPAFGMPKADISGWTIGLGAIIGALVPPIIGAVSDRCRLPMGRRRPFVIGGTVVNIIALLLFYAAFQAKNFAGYIGAWMLINLGNNIATGAFSGIIPDVVPHAERGMASGFMAAMQQAGMIGGFLVGGFLLMKEGQEQDFLALLIITVFMAVICGVTVLGTHEKRLEHAEPFRWSELKDCFWISPKEHPDFAWVWVQRAVFTLGWNLVQANLLFFLADVIWIALGKADPPPTLRLTILALIVLLCAIPTGLLGGILSDKYGRKRIIFLAASLMGVTSLLFGIVGYLPAEMRQWATYLFGVFWGAGYGAYLSVDWALGTDVLPNPDDAGKDMGVWHLSMTIPQTVAAPAAALLLKPFVLAGGESYRIDGYTVLFGASTVLMFLCATLIFKVKKAK